MTFAMFTELLLWCLVVAAYLAQARELRRVNRALDEANSRLEGIAREISRRAIADKVLRGMRR